MSYLNSTNPISPVKKPDRHLRLRLLAAEIFLRASWEAHSKPPKTLTLKRYGLALIGPTVWSLSSLNRRHSARGVVGFRVERPFGFAGLRV